MATAAAAAVVNVGLYFTKYRNENEGLSLGFEQKVRIVGRWRDGMEISKMCLVSFVVPTPPRLSSEGVKYFFVVHTPSH